MAHKRPLIMLSALLVGGIAGGAFAQTTPLKTPPNPGQTAQPAPAPAATPDLDAARAALSAGRLSDAQTRFEALIASDYSNADAHFGLGLTLYALGDLTGARFEFQQLVKLAPERFEGYYNLGVVASRAQQYDEALANYTKALEVAGSKAPAATLRQLLDALAAEQARRHDYVGLSKTQGEALKLTPNDDALRLKQADATFRAGNGPDALPLVYAVLHKQPGNLAAALLIADIYAAQNLPDRSLRELDKALAATTVRADKARLLMRKADLLSAGSKAKEAASALRGAAQLDPTLAAAPAKLGELLLARGDRKGALGAWQAAVQQDPKNTLYRVNLASVQLVSGQFGAARTTAAAVQQSAADPALSARAQFVLGVAAYHQGDYAAAKSALQSASLKAPSAESLLWLGLSEYALGDYAGAVTALEASVKAAPELNARANLGAALLAAGRYPEAEATLRGVVADAPGNGEAWFNLGWSVRSQGREDEARHAFKTSANLGYQKAKGALH